MDTTDEDTATTNEVEDIPVAVSAPPAPTHSMTTKLRDGIAKPKCISQILSLILLLLTLFIPLSILSWPFPRNLEHTNQQLKIRDGYMPWKMNIELSYRPEHGLWFQLQMI